jgi:poly-gamma-glutamate synthesis protein (capsule biosynthesis protein)
VENVDDSRVVTLFLCGDVMTGRGIDHVLAHPSAPELVEPYAKDASVYVLLAEAASGSIPRPLRDREVWGDALAELAHVSPRVKLANLETSVTTSPAFWPDKGIHYRMHPANVGCLLAARLDVVTLANNHVLDFGAAGLLETLDVLTESGVRTAGAGRTNDAAQAPAVVPLLPGSRLVIFGVADASSGVYPSWAATPAAPGVDLLPDLSPATADELLARVRRSKRSRDVVVTSIHWGSNWGYDVPLAHRRFAHRLIEGGVDLVHGHSSHHPRPIEIYRDRLILYGCGDFINDYEGISGYEEYRDDLTLMYFPSIDVETGQLESLRLVPLRRQRFRLTRPSSGDQLWLRDRISVTSERFGTAVDVEPDGAFAVRSATTADKDENRRAP